MKRGASNKRIRQTKVFSFRTSYFQWPLSTDSAKFSGYGSKPHCTQGSSPQLTLV